MANEDAIDFLANFNRLHSNDYKAWSYSRLNQISSSDLRKRRDNPGPIVIEVK